MSLSHLLRGLVLACCVGGAWHVAVAQSPKPASAPLPIEDFIQRPQFQGARLSPDGKFLAAITPVKDRRGLVVVDLESKKGQVVAAFGGVDIGWFRWVNNKRLVYDIFDAKSGLGDQKASGLFAIDRDGKAAREISPVDVYRGDSVNFIYRAYYFESPVGKDSDEIYATGNQRSAESMDLYRYDTRTGRATLLTPDTPGQVRAWVHREGVPRLAVAGDRDTGVTTVYHTEGPGKPFEKLISFEPDERGWLPVGFEDDKTVIVSTNLGRDTSALARYDLATRKITEVLAEHPRFDIESDPVEGEGGFASVRPSMLITDPDTRKTIGLRTHLEKETTLWFDETWAKWQADMDGALPGRVNRLTRTGDAEKVFVTSYSDRHPGTHFFYYPKQRKLEEIFPVRPWIDEARMGERRYLTYKARDGREIPAYVTLPPGKEAKGLPLVVHPHGGPWLRNEYWEWDTESQFLASRGYVVLQPEFRGARGFGYDHFKAGWKQWGLAMQDDLADGVQHLVAQGIVDAKRVCIMGGSYGGYATVMGLVKHPEVYKCGINVVGVTASEHMFTVTWTDFSRYPAADVSLRKVVGDPDKDKEILDAGNGVKQAARIQAPMLIVHGLLDRRVPIVNAERLRSALDTHKKPYEWVVYNDEGHGFLKPENRLDYFRRVETFLQTHIGASDRP